MRAFQLRCPLRGLLATRAFQLRCPLQGLLATRAFQLCCPLRRLLATRASAPPASPPAAPAPSLTALAAAAASAPPHLRLLDRGSGVLVCELDAPGERLNLLDAATIAQLTALLARLEAATRAGAAGAPRALIMSSAKRESWVAGADIKMLAAARTEADWAALSRGGHALMARLRALPFPTVAAINGAALGGGLELALACSARVATPAARLALPEVKLGLLPGAGGCTFLPRLVGAQAALGVMTTGRTVRPAEALKMGLVGAVVEPANLLTAAHALAEELAARTVRKGGGGGGAAARAAGAPASWLRWALEGNPLGRALLFAQAARAVEAATGGRYPAPREIVRVVRAGLEGGEAAGLAAEAAGFGRLGMTDESRALRGLFFAAQSTKTKGAVASSSAPTSEIAPTTTVGVLGAGLMGAGIALAASEAGGMAVVLTDRSRAALARGEAQVRAALDARVRKRRLTKFEADAIDGRIQGSAAEDEGGAATRRALARCDLVVEAVPEELGLKHAALVAAQRATRADAVFATNTSALSIASVAAGAETHALAARVVGLHFFSPADVMPLCEATPHAGTAPDALAAAVAAAQRMGKTVIVVRDVPGFFVNRCLAPMLAEAFALVQAGVPPPVLDAAMTRFGMPLGPCALADEVGLDVAAHVTATMTQAIGARMEGPSPHGLDAAVAAGYLGRKSGKGFYIYGGKEGPKGKAPRAVNADFVLLQTRKHRPVGLGYAPAVVAALMAPGDPAAQAALAERLVLRFLKECVHALEEGVIRSAGDGDIGAVYGLGFSPFLGGPFRLIDSRGPARVVAAMERLAAAAGEHFAPPALLRAKAAAGERFHSD